MPLIRVPVSPSEQNGLKKDSEIMVDLIQTASMGKIGNVVGHLEKEIMLATEGALLLYLGLG